MINFENINLKRYTNNFHFKFIIILVLFFLISIIIFNKKHSASINNSNLSYLKDKNIFFNLTSVNIYFSYKFNKIELEYTFLFFDREKKFIFPSDLSLYYNLHVFCILNNGNNSLLTLSNIHQNKFFKCLEYYELNTSANFEIKICNDAYNCSSIYLFDTFYLNYNYFKFLDDDKFDSNYINKQYSFLLHKIQNSKSDLYLLKKSYISNPVCSIKEKAITSENKWYLKNIYNHYFCFCYGSDCKPDKDYESCKYYLYLSFIDDNQNLYEKTYYLLADFLYGNKAPGDAYFVFREMINQNMTAFYLTERKDIIKEYYDNKTNFQKIIPIINHQYEITGTILEKYLTFFLKLKCVISGSEFYSKENIFFRIQYITFICLGHGIDYFKPFLYNDYYGCKRYNKILLPSDKIISIAKQYGWKDQNIIKIGLPKWDLINNYTIQNKNKLKEKCIFMMFTWRNLKKKKEISSEYFNNILRILNDSMLNQILYYNNITLYFSLHHNLLNKRNKIAQTKNAKYIEQEDILNCLMKCDLVISDFSSIIFEFMYRKKPIIIFIPDSEEKYLNELYDEDYCNIINSLKNDTIMFENKFFKVEEAINKIKYYISNNFQLDRKLKMLYEKFNLNGKNNINRFIKYIKSLTI